MRHVASALAVLVASTCALAADVPIAGADKPVPAGKYAELSVKIEDGDKVTWRVFPPPVQKTTFEKDPGRLVCIGKPGVEYRVSVSVVNFKKEKLDENEVPLYFEGTPDPPKPPGPKPPDPKPPDPTPGTSPFPDPGLRMLLVIPGKDGRLTQNQFDIIYGEDVGKFLESTLGDNYRIYPVTTQVDAAPKVWKDAFMRKRPPPTLPWVLVGNGKTGYEGDLTVTNGDGSKREMTPEEFKALIQKYAVK